MAYLTDINFNEINLAALNNIRFKRVNLDTPPTIALSGDKLARNDGRVLFNREFDGRTIVIEGIIIGKSRETFYIARDILLRYLNSQEATLRVPYNGEPIEFTATVQNIIFSNTGGGYGEFSISFLCSDPFGYDQTTRTIISNTPITTASSNLSYFEPIGGSYHTPSNITMTLVSVTGGTGKYIDISNQSGDNIRITRTWSDGDVLVLDMKAKTCRVNGAAVDYTGTFWDMSVDDLFMTHADNLTTRRAVYTVTYKRRRL